MLGSHPLLLYRMIYKLILHFIPFRVWRDIGSQILLLVLTQQFIIVLIADILKLLQLPHTLQPLIILFALILLSFLLKLFLFVALIHYVVKLLLVELLHGFILFEAPELEVGYC